MVERGFGGSRPVSRERQKPPGNRQKEYVYHVLELDLGPTCSPSPVLVGVETSPSLQRALRDAGSSKARRKWRAPFSFPGFPERRLIGVPTSAEGTRPSGTPEGRRFGADLKVGPRGTRPKATAGKVL
jgi:hypothetical protein